MKATQITGVRVRFIPEVHRDVNAQVTTRSMVDNNIFWEEWGGTPTQGESGNGNDGGGSGSDQNENPLE